MKTSSRSSIVCGALAFLLPIVAHAHPGHDGGLTSGDHFIGGGSGLAAGFLHPLTGWDHLLAMIAVGLWAVQLGGSALWKVPASFIGAMIVGGALGMAHLPLPLVEPGILASVLVLGLLIACSARLPLGACMAVVGVFAILHGFAHGAEMPVTASGFTFGLGFAIATALLHGAGIGFGVLLARTARQGGLRLAGGAVALAGVALCA